MISHANGMQDNSNFNMTFILLNLHQKTDSKTQVQKIHSQEIPEGVHIKETTREIRWNLGWVGFVNREAFSGSSNSIYKF